MAEIEHRKKSRPFLPSGSGKSALIFEVLAKGDHQSRHNKVSGLEQFSKAVEIEQSANSDWIIDLGPV